MSVFAGGRTPQQGDAEKGTGRAVLHHLCESYLGVATEVASVEGAALLGVKRFQAGGMPPTQMRENDRGKLSEGVPPEASFAAASEFHCQGWL